MYSIEELAAWRVESINRIHVLESALREARKAFKIALNTVECDSINKKDGSELPWYYAAKKSIKSIDALFGKEGK